MERNLAVDRDSQNSNFGDHPESQTGMHITYGMHIKDTQSHTFTSQVVTMLCFID